MPEQLDPAQTISAPQSQDASAVNSADNTAAGTGGSGADAPPFGSPAAAGEVGTLGPYRVLKQLGAGGMGAVYLALDTRLDRKLAFKVMLPAFAADTQAKERFLREARAAAKISHDNVVTVFEADERDGVPYIAMQYLQGAPLDEYLKNKGVPPLPHVIRIARETALGLAAAHALGLVHRDIKPANLWLESPNGRVKVLDFGLARAVDAEAELTKSGAVVGTPAYMSPEQARGQKVDHRTDLFSLGGVLYRLCTSTPPFSGPNVMAVLMALGSDDPTPVRELNPNVPVPLAELIHQLLAKKADDRPQTAAEVAKRLRAILEQLVAAPKGSGSGTAQAVVTSPSPPAADISNSMPVVVHPLPQQPPIVVPMQITAQPESAFANLGASADDATEVVPASTAAAKPERKQAGGKWPLVAAGAAALLALVVAAGVIVIKIKNKDGTETEIKVPDGATVTVEKGGKKVAQVGPDQPKPPVKGGEAGAAVVTLPPKPWVPPAAVPVGQSPFDKLDPKEIPAADRFDWQPKELVAVAGTHSPRAWAKSATGGFAVSPDGSLVATGGQHSPLRVWDVKTRTLKADLPGYGGYAVAFEPDGKGVVATHPRVRWNLTAPAEPPTEWVPGPDTIYSEGVWFAPDASRVVVSNGPELVVWDLTAKPGKALARFPKQPHQWVAVTPDGKRMAHYSHTEKRVLVHDLSAAGAKERRKLDAGGGVLALSPDWTRLVGRRGGENDRRQVWDLTADPPSATDFDDPAPPLGYGDGRDWPIAFSPDGKRLVTQTRDGSALRLWDMSGAPKEVWTKPFPVFGVFDREYRTQVGFAGADGRTLVAFAGLGFIHFIDVSGAEPKWLNPIEPTEPAGGRIKIDGTTGCVWLARAVDQRLQRWDFGQGKPTPLDAVAPVGTVAVTPDGGKAAVWANDKLTLMVGGKPAGELPGMDPLGGAFTADGRTYWGIVRGGGITSWDVSGAAPQEGRTFTPPVGDGPAWGVSLHRGDTVLAVHAQSKLTFWDLTRAEPRLLSTFPSPADPFVTVVFPDAERVLTYDNVTPQLWQWKATGWAKVWEGDESAVVEVFGAGVPASHPSARYFALYAQGKITVRRAEDGAVVHTVPCKTAPQRLAFAPDGRHLFVANGFNTVYVLRLPDFTGAADRAAAEWVLSVGGGVQFHIGENQRSTREAKDLPNETFTLYNVNLDHCKGVKGTDLTRLRGLSRLNALYLAGTGVTDADLIQLKEHELGRLTLDASAVTDAGLVHLKNVVGLWQLSLNAAQITDEGLRHLAAVSRLTWLDVRNTKVTKAGVEKLAKALPKCKIEWDGGVIEPKP